MLRRARPLLAAHARALYKLGELSYLRLLLSVDRPSDFFRGYRFVSALARRDNERMAGFRADLQSLTDTRADLVRRTREATALRAQLEGARRELDDRAAEEDRAPDLDRREEGDARRLRGGAGARRRASSAASSRASAEGRWRCRCPRSVARCPGPRTGSVRSGFGRHKHPRFDTYTVQNGIEIESAAGQPGPRRLRGDDRLRGPLPRLRPDGGARPRRRSTTPCTPTSGEAGVEVGQKVAAGDVLGTVGATSVEGPGLYFEMRFQGRPEDPAGLAQEIGPSPGCYTASMSPRSRLLVALALHRPHRLRRPRLAPRPRARRHELRPARHLQRGRAPRARGLRGAREPRPRDGGSAPGPRRRARRRQRLPRPRGVPALPAAAARGRTRTSARCSPGASRFLMVVAARAGSPAEKAGLRTGDILKSIDGRHSRASGRSTRPAAAARRPGLGGEARASCARARIPSTSRWCASASSPAPPAAGCCEDGDRLPEDPRVHPEGGRRGARRGGDAEARRGACASCSTCATPRFGAARGGREGGRAVREGRGGGQARGRPRSRSRS